MDFTREPIIETVITPKEGCKLVVRSSKSTAQEEYFVDAVEVVSFGHSFFFRSIERPKAFLVPVSDYEVLEVREARMVLKNVGIDRAIKIGGGRDAQMRGVNQREHLGKAETIQTSEESVDMGEAAASIPMAEVKPTDPRLDKKRDRRRQYRRRRGREEEGVEGRASDELLGSDNKEIVGSSELSESKELSSTEEASAQPVMTSSILTSLLPPPAMLISETIARYKDNALFRGAFYSKDEIKSAADEEKEESLSICEEEKEEEKAPVNEEGPVSVIAIAQPEYGSFEVSEEEEEQIYQQRKQQMMKNDEADIHQQNVSGIAPSEGLQESVESEFFSPSQEPIEEPSLFNEPAPTVLEEDEVKKENDQL